MREKNNLNQNQIKKIILATKNQGKVKEIKNKLAKLPIEIDDLASYPTCPQADEPYQTYLENAQQKAQIVAKHTGEWALADDSGIEVAGLNWGPGVKSARYAGESCSYSDNYIKMLQELEGQPETSRQAVFRCCMILVSPQGKEISTQGELWGVITLAARGKHGFGYDPIFELPKLKKTLAELSLAEKNQISHRTQALEKLISILMRQL